MSSIAVARIQDGDTKQVRDGGMTFSVGFFSAGQASHILKSPYHCIKRADAMNFKMHLHPMWEGVDLST